MPGIGVRTGTRILLEVGDATAFASAAHLASYAGIVPITHRSGNSIRGERPARSGNHKLNGRCSCPRSPHCTTRPASAA
jgi:transposase